MILKDKIVIVTGGTSGIGLAIARLFVEEGAQVVIASPSVEKGEGIAKEISAKFVRTDVSQEADCKNLVDETVKEFGKLDVLVNNAGISLINGDKFDIAGENFEKIFHTNVKGVVMMIKYALPELLRTKGNVVNIASRAGIQPDVDVPVYSASKAAVVIHSRALARAFGKQGVRFNCVCPGAINTAMQRSYFENENEMKEWYKERSPVGRIGEPEDVSRVALFLADERNSFVTGVSYVVDGGTLA